MKKRLHVILAVIISAIILISCQPNVVSTPSGGNGDIQDIHVQVSEPTKTTSKVEQFPLPNCGGSDKLAQSLGTFASVSKSATVGAKATVTGGGEVAVPETAKLKLEIQVELAYQQTFESANSRLDTIEMSAAEGTHVVYTIIWEEQTFNSIVQYSSDGKVYEVPYTYQLSVPKIDKSYNVACDGNNGGNNGIGNAPTITPSQSAGTSPSECTPPTGLVPLWKSEPIWSVGIWGSPNVVNFKSALGEIDTNDPDYGEFSIWIDPCYAGTIPGHGYTDGGRFWAKRTGIGITSTPIPLGGSEATIINDIPANTGIWGLGPRY
jgi:hypothetical protein